MGKKNSLTKVKNNGFKKVKIDKKNVKMFRNNKIRSKKKLTIKNVNKHIFI